MKKLIMLALLVLGAGASFGQASLGDVMGDVVDKGDEAVVDAHVYIDDVFGQRYQTKTDFDGSFRISGIPSGDYMLNIRYKGDTIPPVQVRVTADRVYNVGKITFGVLNLGDVVVVANQGLKLIDGDLPVKTLSSEEIQQSPQKFSVSDMVESMSSEIQKTASGELVIRGARPGDLLYLIDGVKADMGPMPSAGIGSITVYTGGVPAKYGDTLGGVVIMETKSYFDLYRAWEAQRLKAGK